MSRALFGPVLFHMLRLTLLSRRFALAMLLLLLLPFGDACAFKARGGTMSNQLSRSSIGVAAVAAILLASLVGGAAQDSRYKLRSGDTLDLNFVYVPEFNQTVTIQPDGFVTLRAV